MLYHNICHNTQIMLYQIMFQTCYAEPQLGLPTPPSRLRVRRQILTIFYSNLARFSPAFRQNSPDFRQNLTSYSLSLSISLSLYIYIYICIIYIYNTYTSTFLSLSIYIHTHTICFTSCQIRGAPLSAEPAVAVPTMPALVASV